MLLLESRRTNPRLNIVLLIAGLCLLLLGLFADPIEILRTVGFPAKKLYGERGQADLAIVRSVTLVVSLWLIASQVVIWKDPLAVTKIVTATKGFISAAKKLPLFTMWILSAVVLVKTALQLSLYFLGYRAYAGDDFARSWRADEWLQHLNSSFDLEAWLNIGDPYLPFPDYVFGLALALYRDVYFTPKVMNLLLSGIAVVVAYLLGRKLFGRVAGLFTAILCAFQPWIIWLGISGMTSDILSVVMIASFGLFLYRWLDANDSSSLLIAAGCLFAAAGIRYENWFFSVVFSLVLVYKFVSAMRMGDLTPKLATVIGGALVIANAFPVFHMAASYYLVGDLIPAMQQTDSFRVTTGPPIPKINMALLALSAFPMEIAVAVTGIVLFLKSERRSSPRVYLLIVVITLVSFAAAFKGRLPLHGAGPERNLLTYIVLLLPYAGYFLTRLFQAPRLANPVYAVLAISLLLTLGTFDIARAFNYPAKKYDRDAFAAGWTLRMLQGIENIPDDAKVILEKGEEWVLFPIMVVANKPERFIQLEDGDVGKACAGGFETQGCEEQVLGGKFNLVILWSPERVQTFKKIFGGRSWQIGKYHIFEVNASANNSESIDSKWGLSRSR
jgi:hypothetical protein